MATSTDFALKALRTSTDASRSLLNDDDDGSHHPSSTIHHPSSIIHHQSSLPLPSPLSPNGHHSLSNSTDSFYQDHSHHTSDNDLLQSDPSSSKRFRSIDNLDQFFERVYRYFLERGFQTICVSRLLNLLSLAFVILFTSFLILYVNWSDIMECNSASVAATCDTVNVINSNPFSSQHTAIFAITIFYAVIFGVYLAWCAWTFAVDVRNMWEMSCFYSECLLINDRDLQTLRWNEVVQALRRFQSRDKFWIVKDDFDALDITNRIMRKENYLIALMNKNILSLSLPIPFLKHTHLTKTLEWNIYFCILNAMLDMKEFKIREDFIRSVGSLKRRFIAMGFMNMLLSPFILVFLILYFLLKHAEEFHRHPTMAAQRRWSPTAEWKMREFNELPHFFHSRLSSSYKAADIYVLLFPSPLLSTIARFISFIAGSFMAVLIGMSLVDESVLLYIKIGGRNLLWYVAILGIIIAICRGFTSDMNDAVHIHPRAAMLNIARHTHFYPKRWRNKEHSSPVYMEVFTMYQYRIVTFFQEILSVIFAPLILWFSLPSRAEEIVALIRDKTVHMAGVGDVCVYATFNLKSGGNHHYASNANVNKFDRCKQGKLEKSLLSFKMNNSDYVLTGDAIAFIQNLKLNVNKMNLKRRNKNDPSSVLKSIEIESMNNVGSEESHHDDDVMDMSSSDILIDQPDTLDDVESITSILMFKSLNEYYESHAFSEMASKKAAYNDAVVSLPLMRGNHLI